MFKYNKSSNLYINVYRNNINKHNTNIQSRLSTNSYKAYNVILNQQNLQKIKNINMLNQIRTNKKLVQLGNINNITNNSQNNIKQFKNLPKPRSYQSIKQLQNNTIIIQNQKDIAKLLNKINENQINQFKNNDIIAQKPVQTITQTSGLINLLQNIDNNQSNISTQIILSSNIIENNIKNQQINQIKQQNKQKSQQQLQVLTDFKYVISNQQLLNKAKYIVETLQVQIYSNPQYNYYKLIQFVHNLYEQYGNNKMALMIICKGFSQFNKKQLIKLPQDKIGDIIQYIISQIKKDK